MGVFYVIETRLFHAKNIRNSSEFFVAVASLAKGEISFENYLSEI